MPANRNESEPFLRSICCGNEIAEEYAVAALNDLDRQVHYGPEYSRFAWENLCDAVRMFARREYAHAERFMRRAYIHADVPYDVPYEEHVKAGG